MSEEFNEHVARGIIRHQRYLLDEQRVLLDQIQKSDYIKRLTLNEAVKERSDLKREIKQLKRKLAFSEKYSIQGIVMSMLHLGRAYTEEDEDEENDM